MKANCSCDSPYHLTQAPLSRKKRIIGNGTKKAANCGKLRSSFSALFDSGSQISSLSLRKEHGSRRQCQMALHYLTLPTPVVPVNMTDLFTTSSFSIRNPYLTVSTVGTSRSKYGISGLYLNDGIIFSHGSRRRVSKSTK